MLGKEQSRLPDKKKADGSKNQDRDHRIASEEKADRTLAIDT
jgi:hypothetical protein